MERALLFLAFASAGSTQAQTTIWENYVPQVAVRDIVSDDASVWIATQGGLVHIDVVSGARSWFDRSNSGLPSNDMMAVSRAEDGTLWAATVEGLAHFDGALWTTYRTDNSPLLQARVDQVASGPNGEVWLHGGYGGMIQKLENGTWSTVDPGVIGIMALAVEANGDLLVGTSNNGLLRYDGSGWTAFNTGNSGIPNNLVPHVAVAPSGLVYLRCGVNVVTFDGSAFASYPIPVDATYSSNVDHIHVDDDGTCYAVTSAYYYPQPNPTNVLFPRCLRSANGSWEDLHHYGFPGAPEGPMGAITVDGSGTLWTGANRFYSLTNSTWATEEYETNAPGQVSIPCMHAADDGRVWATGMYSSTDNRYVMEGDTWSEFNSGQLMTINDIITDTDGEPILATPGGVLWANGFSWEQFNSSNAPFPSDYIEELFMDNDGALWVIPDEGGLLKYDGSWTLYNTSNAPLSSNDVTSIAQHTDGTYWIGTGNGAAGGGGVSRFDGTDWTTWTPANANLPFNIFVRDISITSDGTPWFLLDRTTELDLVARFDGTDFVLYDALNSTLPQYMTCLIIGPQDIPMVGTPFEGLKYLQPGIGNWSAFDITNSGIASNNVSDLSLAPNEDLWIGTGGGGVNRLTVDFFQGVGAVARVSGGITVLPSLTDQHAELLLDLPAPEHIRIEVMDACGRLLMTLPTRSLPEGSHRIPLETADLASGSYSCRVIGNTLRTSKFQVQH